MRDTHETFQKREEDNSWEMKSVGVSEGKQHTLRQTVPVCSRAWIDNLSKSPMRAGWKEKGKV